MENVKIEIRTELPFGQPFDVLELFAFKNLKQ